MSQKDRKNTFRAPAHEGRYQEEDFLAPRGHLSRRSSPATARNKNRTALIADWMRISTGI